MKKYELKKKIVEAIQWRGGVRIPGARGLASGAVVLDTDLGELPLFPGCYVVYGIDANPYVMSEEVFTAAYKPVPKPRKKAAKKEATKKPAAKRKAAKKTAAKK